MELWWAASHGLGVEAAAYTIPAYTNAEHGGLQHDDVKEIIIMCELVSNS